MKILACIDGSRYTVSVCDHAAWAANRLGEPVERLRQAGYSVSGDIRSGDPDRLIPATVDAEASDLLVMGAYGHSRIRELMIGSTTTSVLRTSTVSVLVIR